MREAVHVARAEDETAAELERVRAKFVLTMAGGSRASTSARIIGTQ